MSPTRRMKADLYLSPYKKANFKWIKYINVNPETLKLLEENIGSAPYSVDVGKDFLNWAAFDLELKPTIDQLDFIK